MKITAIKVTGKDLKAGDLFSMASQSYWDSIHDNVHGKLKGTNYTNVGERVYIRTETPCPEEQKDIEIYKLEVTL